MHRHRVWLFLFAFGGLAATAAAPVVVAVGPRKLTVPEVQAELNALHPAAILEFNSAKQFVEETLVPRLLFSQYLDERLTEATPRLMQAHDAALAHGLESHLHRTTQVTESEIDDYYRAHHQSFERPQAIEVWRIVTRTREQALDILARVNTSSTAVDTWGQLARQHSIDEATRMRNGALGFVQPDGHTDVPQVRVSPDVFAAIAELKDGELRGEPLPLGNEFSVLWRRGSKPALHVSLDEAKLRISSLIARGKANERLALLLAELRETHLREFAPDALELIEYPLPSAGARRQAIHPHPASAAPHPTTSPQGER